MKKIEISNQHFPTTQNAEAECDCEHPNEVQMKRKTQTSNILGKDIDCNPKREIFRLSSGFDEASRKDERWFLDLYPDGDARKRKGARFVISDQFMRQVVMDVFLEIPPGIQCVIELIEKSVELFETSDCFIVDGGIAFRTRTFQEWAARKNVCIYYRKITSAIAWRRGPSIAS